MASSPGSTSTRPSARAASTEAARSARNTSVWGSWTGMRQMCAVGGPPCPGCTPSSQPRTTISSAITRMSGSSGPPSSVNASSVEPVSPTTWIPGMAPIPSMSALVARHAERASSR